jgi:hypothetical protein
MLGNVMESHGTAKKANWLDEPRFLNTDDHINCIIENVI